MAYSSKTIMYGVSHVMNSQIHLMQQLALQSPSFSLNPVHHKLALCVTPSPLYLLTLLPVVHKNQKAMTGPRSSLFPRSEERRVGKECRSRISRNNHKTQ